MIPRIAVVFLLSLAAALAQTEADKLAGDHRMMYEQVKSYILKSVDKMPADQYGFRPAPEVRTFQEVLAHIADAQNAMCGIAKGETKQLSMADMQKTEKTVTDREGVVAALKNSFAVCDAAYSALTDANATDTFPFFGRNRSRLMILNLVTVHGFEHYGNLTTYMRIKGIVPPSSDRPPAAKPKPSGD